MSKFIDIASIIQVIGCIYNSPNILDLEDKYVITEDDFSDEFHKIIFGTIYKLYSLGAKQITLESISDFLSDRPKFEAIFKQNKGEEYLIKISEMANSSTFDYYYNRMKKMTLLRAYDSIGMDVSFLYDPNNILDSKKKQIQEDWLDNTSIENIANAIDDKIDSIRLKYVDDEFEEASQAGDGAEELIDRFKETPEIGVPLYGNLINTVTRGARLKKFYLRSAPTGMGKTRAMVADACNIGCHKIYDSVFGWMNNGAAEPTLFITTEQELEEVQTMMMAFLSNVDEEHILNGTYSGDEEERVRAAARLLKESPIYIEERPDFSLHDIENVIKKNIREHGVKYIFHDYIHSSLKILEEITKRSGGVKLREDNILFMISIRLKDICNQYGVFILSSTQLNAEYQDSKTPDQNLLRGAKSIADKIDFGSILLTVNEKDLASLESLLKTNVFQTPNIKMSIYKNRRGRYKGVYLWCKADLSTCRIQPIFMTGFNYELIDIEDTKIKVEAESAF